MKNLKAFNQFISEEISKDDESELKGMGFSDYSEPFEERYETLVNEWSSDPEVNAAIDILKAKFNELFAKHIDSESDDDAQELEQAKTWMYDSSGIDDIGWFEYILLNDLY
jgi:hypothetical protein